jgi:hypothetical protein
MELENIILSEVSQAQKAKATCSPSYADYQLKTNAAMLWNMGHTKGRPCTKGIGQRKEAKTSNVVGVFAIQE